MMVAGDPPLAGIKVLDLTRVLAGPWCTQTLADLGADVWKVEAPEGGDDTRTWLKPQLGGEATYFMSANRSKRSLAVNLRHAQGQAIVRALAERADVLVENFRLGALDRFGLGYDALAKVNPRLIYCSISGYGRTGPRAEEAGYDFVIQAESGLMAITGEPDGAPMRLGVAITDIATGMNAVQAILAALLARHASGKGQLIDLSLHDTAVALLANIGQGCLATGEHPGRFGNAHASIVPYQTFPSADGMFVLAVGNNSQFRQLCEQVLERAELALDERFRSNVLRIENRVALVEILSAIFRTRPTREWIGRLNRAGVPGGEVREVLDALASPEVAARRMVAEMPDARHGTLRTMASPLHLSDTPPRAPSAPPRLGEHTDAILAEVLGASVADIAAWRAGGAIA
jgi:crotonobetainyl-CoA:carnitine CoA-transferase CaiB-like acyl-CoA transferase